MIAAWVTLGLMALAVERLEAARGQRLWPLLVIWQAAVYTLIAVAVWCSWDDIYPPRPPR